MKTFRFSNPISLRKTLLKMTALSQPFGDSPLDGETVSVNIYLDILSQAKDYVYIFTPYLAVSDELNIALCAAAKRGGGRANGSSGNAG